MPITSSIEEVTPERAAKYLALVPDFQRSRRKRKVSEYAEDMKAGRWTLNGESVVFDSDGHLIDGQHRMAAVVKANVPIRFLVVRGIEPAAYSTIDFGFSRSVADVSAAANATEAAIGGVLCRWDNGAPLSDAITAKAHRVTKSEIVGYTNRNIVRIKEIASAYSRLRKCIGKLPVTAAAAAYAAIEDRSGSDVADTYFDMLASVYEPGSTDYAKSFLKFYMQSSRDREELVRIMLFVYRAWTQQKSCRNNLSSSIRLNEVKKGEAW